MRGRIRRIYTGAEMAWAMTAGFIVGTILTACSAYLMVNA